MKDELPQKRLRGSLLPLHHIFESENFRIPFNYETSLTWGLKCEKLNFRKSEGFYRKIVHEWDSHPEIFCRPQVIENSKQYLLPQKDILQKTVVKCP